MTNGHKAIQFMNVVGGINAYEAGEMDEDEVIGFFQYLLDTGTINHLQGSYQRTAMDLIDQGFIVPPGAGS